MFYNEFFVKDDLQDNNWDGNLVMKPVDAVNFQKIV